MLRRAFRQRIYGMQKMNQKLFWQLIERAYDPQCAENPCDGLKNTLQGVPLGDLVAFNIIYLNYRKSLYTPSHIAAAYLINEGVLNDEYFSMYTEPLVIAPEDCFTDVMVRADGLMDHAVYERVLLLDPYPFSSVPEDIGDQRFGERWRHSMAEALATFSFRRLNDVTLDGKKGVEIVTRDLCRTLVPRLYASLEGICEWYN